MKKRALSILLVFGCASAPTPPLSSGPTASAADVQTTFRALCTNRVQLWVVIPPLRETDSLTRVLKNADAIVQGGGDVIIMQKGKANEESLNQAMVAVKERYPDVPVAIRHESQLQRSALIANAQILWPTKLESQQTGLAPLALTSSSAKARLRVNVRKAIEPTSRTKAASQPSSQPASQPSSQASARASSYPAGIAGILTESMISHSIHKVDFMVLEASAENDQTISREKIWQLRSLMNELGGGTAGAAAPRTMQEMHGDDGSHHHH